MAQYRTERNNENVSKCIFVGAGQFDIPPLIPVKQVNPQNWISFNFAKTCEEPELHGVHFFVDDYQFLRLWNNPDAYLAMMKRFDTVCTPDFSTYTDFPKALQIYNHYRKHWLGAYWQQHGINVIPTISWSDHESYDWCFDGEPVGGAVAVSAVGSSNSAATKQLFIDGYREMMDRLKPSQIIFYGRVPDECEGNIVSIAAYQERLKCNVNKAKGGG